MSNHEQTTWQIGHYLLGADELQSDNIQVLLDQFLIQILDGLVTVNGFFANIEKLTEETKHSSGALHGEKPATAFDDNYQPFFGLDLIRSNENDGTICLFKYNRGGRRISYSSESSGRCR